MIWLLADGFLWSGRTGRLRYLISFFVLAGSWLGLWLIVARDAADETVRTAAIAALAFLIVPLVGFRLRRLHDIGLSGIWAALVAVPYVNLIFELLLFTVPSRDRQYHRAILPLRLVGYLLVVAVIALTLSRIAWQPYWIPAASMKPALWPGDYVLVSREMPLPQRGDVIVLRHPSTGQVHIKRLIGLPGDTVGMSAGQVVLNGAALPQTPLPSLVEPFIAQGPARAMPLCRRAGIPLGGDCQKAQARESLPDGRSYTVLDLRPIHLDDTAPVEVPDGHYFFLGDNRDNSADSRLPTERGGLGMVPADNLIGRAERIVFSAAGRQLAAFWAWRKGRYWVPVE